MKNNKAVLSLLIIAVLFIFGFVAKQAVTQLSLTFPFGSQVAQVSKVTPIDSVTGIRGNGRGGGATDSGEGWTVYVPSATSQVVYVSTTGSDSANCVYTGPGGSRPFGGDDYSSPTNPITPCQSVRNNYSNNNKIRPGQDDFFLLKRGDTWTDETIPLKSGMSEIRKAVIGSWSNNGNTTRPRINAHSGTVVEGNVRYVAITDLHLYLDTPDNVPVDNTGGISLWGNPSNVDIENNKVERFRVNISFANGGATPRVNTIRVRRNISADAFCNPPGSPGNNSGRCFGVFSDGDNNLLEGNIMSHNGFLNNVNSYISNDGQNHNAYMSDGSGDAVNLTNNENVYIRGSDGGKLGSINGGPITNNTFIQNSMAVLSCCEPGQILSNNVVLVGLDYNGNAGWGRGVGFDLGGGNQLTVSNNIFAHQLRGTDNAEAIWFRPGSANTTISGNVFYNWCISDPTGLLGFAIKFDDGNFASTNIIRDNEFQQNCSTGQKGRIFKEENSNPVGPQYRNNKYWVNAGTSGLITGISGYANAGGSTFAQWAQRSGETGSFTQVNYLAPNRDAATYMNMINGNTAYTFGSQAGIDAFDAKLRLQSKWNWDTRYTAAAFNDYIRCGFNKAPLSGSCTGGGGGDTQAPQVSITAPTGGPVTGSVAFTANATDNVAVTRVEFFVDGTRIGVDFTASNTSQYSYPWITSGYANGQHTLVAKAYDAATNVGTSVPVSVTVNNTLSTACQRIDADHNLIFNSNDFTAFLNLFQAGNMAAADIDNNNILNSNDFQAFLNGYAQCHV